MIKKTIEIDVKAGAAEQDIKDLNKSVIKLDSSVEDLGKTGKQSLDNIDKNVKETEKSTKSLSEGFKGAGLAMKAMGIGLVISLMNTLKEIFTSNQKVADTFSAVLGTVATVFSQVTNVIVGVIEKVGGATKGFEGLQNVIGGLLKLSITPLKAAFFGIKLVIDEVRLAWEESLFGDGDPKTIKDLTKRIEETQVSLKKVGTDAIESGKQVANNIGKAINEVGQVVEGTIDGVSKISLKSAYEQSKANVNLQNAAILAEANQARLVEQYDRQAEKLRQVRDEERNTIADRIKANNDLNTVLDNQEAAMLRQADSQIAAAKATLAQNNNVENQAALTRALTNREGVLAQVEGLRSEQKANDLALNKELIDLTKTKQEAETQLAINEANFNAERIKNEEAQLVAKKSALEQNKIIELQNLQNVIDSAKAGTQAKVDAENEYALKKQEIEQQIILADDAIAEYKRNKAIENNQKIIDADNVSFEAKREALKAQEALLLEDKTLSEQQRNEILQQFSNDRGKIDVAEAEQKATLQMQVLDTAAQGVSLIKGLFEKSKGVQKAAMIAESAIGIGKMLIANNLANIGALATPQAIASGGVAAIPTITFNNISTGIGIAANIAATAKALRSLGGGGGGAPSGGNAGGAGGGGGAPAPAPQFNVVGTSGVNQLASTLGQQQPVQAFVVANQVTTQQSLDRNIVQNASLG